MCNRHERGVVIAVGIDDGTGLETAEISGFCDSDEFSVHGVLRFLSGSQVENRSLSSHVSELIVVLHVFRRLVVRDDKTGSVAQVERLAVFVIIPHSFEVLDKISSFLVKLNPASLLLSAATRLEPVSLRPFVCGQALYR